MLPSPYTIWPPLGHGRHNSARPAASKRLHSTSASAWVRSTGWNAYLRGTRLTYSQTSSTARLSWISGHIASYQSGVRPPQLRHELFRECGRASRRCGCWTRPIYPRGRENADVARLQLTSMLLQRSRGTHHLKPRTQKNECRIYITGAWHENLHTLLVGKIRPSPGTGNRFSVSWQRNRLVNQFQRKRRDTIFCSPFVRWATALESLSRAWWLPLQALPKSQARSCLAAPDAPAKTPAWCSTLTVGTSGRAPSPVSSRTPLPYITGVGHAQVEEGYSVQVAIVQPSVYLMTVTISYIVGVYDSGLLLMTLWRRNYGWLCVIIK